MRIGKSAKCSAILGRLLVTLTALMITEASAKGSDGPLGEWPEFVPVGYITAPHPDDPEIQTPLYGDWGWIVGEEFIFLQDGLIKLLYHSYHETYMTEHPHEEEVLHDWALGYDPVTKIKYTPLARPGGPIPGPAWDHTDTPGYIRHPITGEHLLYNTVRPGTKHLHPEWTGLPGHEGAIQVATSDSPPSIGQPFEQSYENMLVAELWWELGWNNNGVVKGGLSEPTPVWMPHLGDNGMVRLFYRGLHGAVGNYWNWRISYADSEDGKTGWVKNPVPVFDPSDPANPAYRWTLPPPEGYNFRGAWQAHCTGDVRADGVHMVMTVSNQNYPGHGRIAYYWSPDWGDTWFGHPDNPILIPGEHPDGVPASGFQRTPTLMIDEEYERYILAYNAGHDANEHWRRRTHLALAERPPEPTALAEEPASAASFRMEAVAARGGSGPARLRFQLPRAGRLRVEAYDVQGRLLDRIVDRSLPGGRQTAIWDKTASDGARLASGIYFLRGSFEALDGANAVASVRILVLR